jgi:hypothetical protein
VNLLGWVALLSIGCQSEDGFNDDFTESYCTLLSDCEVLDIYGYRSVQDCNSQASGVTDECEFDDDAAETCLDDIAATGCRDLWDAGLPDSCSVVCGSP